MEKTNLQGWGIAWHWRSPYSRRGSARVPPTFSTSLPRPTGYRPSLGSCLWYCLRMPVWTQKARVKWRHKKEEHLWIKFSFESGSTSFSHHNMIVSGTEMGLSSRAKWGLHTFETILMNSHQLSGSQLAGDVFFYRKWQMNSTTPISPMRPRFPEKEKEPQIHALKPFTRDRGLSQ